MVILPVSFGIANVFLIFELLTATTLCGTVGEETVYVLNGFDVYWLLLVFSPK